MTRLTIRSVTTCSLDDLGLALEEYFAQDVPTRTPGKLYDWDLAQNQLRYYGNTLSFLFGLHASLASAIRYASKKDVLYTDLAARRDIVNDCIEAMKAKYDSLSRSYTIFTEERKRTPDAA